MIMRSIRRFAHIHVRVLILLAIIGILALALFLYAALFVRTGTPIPVEASEKLFVGTPEFIQTLSRITNSPIGNGEPIRILNNGDEFEPDLLSEIDNATTSISFSTYIWEDGQFSQHVLEALTAAAGRGVTVRLLLDGVKGKPSEDQLKTFQQAGGKVGIFRNTLHDPLNVNSRNHRRAIIIDDRIGYIGGVAIADTWLGDGRHEDEWRDTMFKLTGAMAQSIDAAFDDQWLVTTGEVVVAPIAPSVRMVKEEQRTFIHIVGSAGNKNRPVQATFLLTALSAQKSLYISNPYVLPDRALRTVLEDKARSGVDVRLLVPGPKTDARIVRWASQQFYTELLDAGVHIYEYQPTLLHEKAVVADGTWSLIGSPNIDNRSAEINDENIMGVEDPAFAAALIDNFYGDLDYSVEISPEAWKERSVFHRTVSWLTSIPLKQY